MSDLHIETFEGKTGPGHSLVGRVDDVELVSSQQAAPQQQARQAPPQRPAPQPPRQPQYQAPAPQPSTFDDMDSDIPFATSEMYFDITTSKERKMKKYDY